MVDIAHGIRRFREEGVRTSFRLAWIRLRRPWHARWLRRKFRNYRAEPLLRARTPRGSASQPVFWGGANRDRIAKSYTENFPAEMGALLEIADRICRHDFRWLCPNCPEFGDEIDWHDNFDDHRRWGLDFYQDLDYSSEERLGDVRQVWELNRHQYFMTLARAHVLTGEPRFLEEFKSQFLSWVSHNPVGYGINWLDAQEVALRSVAWTWAFQLFKPALVDDQAFVKRFMAAIYAHADYIECHLSDKAVTHNHLMSETCGLAVLGLMYPQFKRSRQWRSKGVRIFFREVLKQVWEDGLSGELSTNYHCFVLDSCLQLYILLQKNGIRVPAEVSRRLESMVEAVMFILRPDGSLPLVGDCDSGRAFRLTEYRSQDRRAYLSIGAVVFRRNDFKAVARKFHEEAFWLLGPEGLVAFEEMPEETPRRLDKAFLPGGLVVIRSSWDEEAEHLLVRGGPTRLRHGVGTTHNHADFLSFEFFGKNRMILVDPGVYLYGQDDDWRFFYRKTLAHNTVAIDGMDHVDVTSARFGIPSLPPTTLHEYRHKDNTVWLDMSHAGYRQHGISHRRQFLWQKGVGLKIIDQLDGSGHHLVEQFFHFAPEISLRSEDGRIEVLSEDGEKLLELRTAAVAPSFETSVIEGRVEGGIQGWFSGRYAVKQPAPVVRIACRGDLPIRLVTVAASAEGHHLSELQSCVGSFKGRFAGE